MRLRAESLQAFASQDRVFSDCVAVAVLLSFAGNREQKTDVRQRVRKGQKSEKDEGAESDLKEVRDDVSVTSMAEVSSDLNPQDPLQKVVRFSSDMSLLLTGGTDGHIRVWEVNVALLCSQTIGDRVVNSRFVCVFKEVRS